MNIQCYYTIFIYTYYIHTFIYQYAYMIQHDSKHLYQLHILQTIPINIIPPSLSRRRPASAASSWSPRRRTAAPRPPRRRPPPRPTPLRPSRRRRCRRSRPRWRSTKRPRRPGKHMKTHGKMEFFRCFLVGT